MGLDMYLHRKTYVKNWDHLSPSQRHTITYDGPERDLIEPEKISHIIEQVAYWRKANQIHKWFVDNVQDGKDDCNEYNVPRFKLRELVEVCEGLLESRDVKEAQAILPTQSGFFFGGTEYDEYYYWEDLQNTVDQLKDFNPKGEYYYESSW